MRIQYVDGTTMEAALMARTGDTIRVAPRGGEDVLEFANREGTWVSEDCEPVRIQFEWERRGRQPEISEADCICPQELAARLLHLLLSGEDDPADVAAPPDALAQLAPCGMVI